MAIALPPELIDRLRAAQRIVAFTGAGISAESGLSTFRDKQTGLWAKYRPEDLATPQAFQRNPRMVWEWYEWRRGFVAQAEPNPGHHALAEIEAARPGFLLATQNVDGLHARAGSRNLVELHGNIRRTICFGHRHPAESWAPAEESTPRRPAARSAALCCAQMSCGWAKLFAEMPWPAPSRPPRNAICS